MPDIKLDFADHSAQWQSYLDEIKVNEPLPPLPTSEDVKLNLFLSGRNIISNYYSIKEQESRLSKYYITAPFNGAITETYVDRSSLIRVNQQLGEFISTGDFELEASIEYDKLTNLKIGKEVLFKDLKTDKKFSGKLIRINEKVNANNQLVKVYFRILADDLKSGMYLEGNTSSNSYPNAVRLSATALVQSNQVYIVENGKAKLQKVEVLSSTPNEVIVTGLKAGTKVITDQHNSAFEGSEIIEMK